VATASHIGVREARRIRGLQRVEKDHVMSGAKFPDGICDVTFPVDIHSLQKSAGGGYGNAGISSQAYQIPLGALTASDRDGLLLAGRCISGDFYAHASYRVTGNAVAMGEAAGYAAAYCLSHGVSPHQLLMTEVAGFVRQQRSLSRSTAV